MINWIAIRLKIARGNAWYLVLAALWTMFVGGILALGFVLSGRETREAALNIARDRFELNRLARMVNPEPRSGPAFSPDGPHGNDSTIKMRGPNREDEGPTPHGNRIFLDGNLENTGFQGHLTSLQPTRMERVPDPWEQKAFHAFQSGAREFWEIEDGEGGSRLRFMKPLVAAPACMACHPGRGVRQGELLGGISLVVPIRRHLGMFGDIHNLTTALGTLTFWAIGLMGVLAARKLQANREEDRAKSQKALHDSEALFREILERQGEGLAVVDAEERFVLVNRVAEEIFGTPEGTLKGRSLLEFLPEDQRSLLRKQSAQRAEGMNSTYELEIRRESDGTERTLLVTATPKNGLDGGPHQAIGVIRDITERRRAEGALRRSEANMQAILASAAAGILAIDDGRQVLHVNRKFAEIWEIPQELIERKSDEQLLEFALGRLADPAEFLAKVESLYGSDREEADTIIFRDGRTIERYSRPLVLDQKVIGRVWSFLDVTGRIRAEEERGRLQEQLNHARRLEGLGNLAGGVAHNMNNVLAAILGVASSNLTLQPQGSPVHRAFDLIAKAAVRGGKMVQELLHFTRQSPAENRELDLNGILREQAGLLGKADPAPAAIELQLAPDLRAIHGDASALGHAVTNLCNNALEAMGKDGRLVLRTCNRPDGWVEARVEDNGAGMTREVRDRAFDPFYTTKDQGAGLGLSLAYTIVKAHGGQVEIRSEPGQGTTVSLLFPPRQGPAAVPDPV